jgi:hypothetical protein
MKSKKTNILLGIIAINLTLLTLIQLEIWPTKANANELGLDPSINYGLVPLNEDGSIDVNISSMTTDMDVNIRKVAGRYLATYGAYTGSDGESYNTIGVKIIN